MSFAEAAAELKVPPMSAAQVVASTLEAAGNWILGREAMINMDPCMVYMLTFGVY